MRKYISNLTSDQEKSLIYESEVIQDLEMCWKPHAAQAKIKHAIFAQGKKLIFLECGRKFGKTETLAYNLYRFAMLFPNSACYFIAPFQKQAKELVWANNRLQNFLMPVVDPKTGISHSGLNREQCHQVLAELTDKYGVKVNDSEMRIRFGNGSFIKLDGADNHQAYRGISPHLIVYDEYKDHHPKFHVGMDPNLATFDAPLILVGTPPEGDEPNAEQFWSLADYAKIADHGAYYNAPTLVNPYISKEWLKRKKEELFKRGEEDKWYREYMAQRVRSGSRSIFPMFEPPDEDNPYTKQVKKHEDLWVEVKHYKKDWDFFWSFDPGSATVFAGVFGCINKYSKKVIILEEIYRTKKSDTSTGQVFPYALKILDKYSILWDDCRMIYDNAATWFSNEVADRWGFNLEPCRKDVNKKEDRLSLIKDMMLGGYLEVSEKCEKFIWELWNYRVDEKGKIPKENDHTIDAFRYLLSNAYYNDVPREPLKKTETQRGYTMEQDRVEFGKAKDPFSVIRNDYYL